MNKEKAVLITTTAITAITLGTVVFASASAAAANGRNKQRDVNVQKISWHTPDEFKEADTVVKYDVTVNEAEYQFNPDAYIHTVDDNLTNYAVPLLKDWSNVSQTFTDYEAPDISSNNKTYMRFQNLGYNTGNKQSALSRGAYAYTGDYQMRMVDGRYLVALGTYYTSTIGQYVDIMLEDGTVLPCILGDVKSDTHTDETRRYQKWDKSVLEFIVDSPIITHGADKYDYFHAVTGLNGNFSDVGAFSSKVKTIRVYDKVFPIRMGDTTNDNPDLY